MNRKLWLIWKEPKNRQRFTIGLLNYNGNEYQFEYINPELEDACQGGFSFYPGFENLNQKYVSKELFPPKRPDYLEILNSYNLDTSASDLDILIATKGRLITDNYEFVPVFNLNKIEFEIAGISHSKDIGHCKEILKENVPLILEPEKENKQDKYAIKILVKINGQFYHLGYVPRYYSKNLSESLEKSISYSAMIEKVRFESLLSDENITVVVKLVFDNKEEV